MTERQKLVITSEDGQVTVKGYVRDVVVGKEGDQEWVSAKFGGQSKPYKITGYFVPDDQGVSYTVQDLSRKQLEVIKSLSCELTNEFEITTARVEAVRQKLGAPKHATFNIIYPKKNDGGIFVSFNWNESI